MIASKEGSSLLLVLIVVSAVMLCVTATWKSASLMFDIVLKKQKHEQLFRSTEGLLNYGIAICKDHFSQLIMEGQKGNNDCVITFAQWPVGNSDDYKGSVRLISEQNRINVYAKLFTLDNTVSCSLSCVVQAEVADNEEQNIAALHVNDWKYLTT